MGGHTGALVPFAAPRAAGSSAVNQKACFPRGYGYGVLSQCLSAITLVDPQPLSQEMRPVFSGHRLLHLCMLEIAQDTV